MEDDDDNNNDSDTPHKKDAPLTHKIQHPEHLTNAIEDDLAAIQRSSKEPGKDSGKDTTQRTVAQNTVTQIAVAQKMATEARQDVQDLGYDMMTLQEALQKRYGIRCKTNCDEIGRAHV